MLNPDYLSKKMEEGIKSSSSYWLGRAKGEERDGRIKNAIKTYRVLSVELLMAKLDMEPTASSRRIVETRLHQLGKRKYQKDVRKIREGNVTYYVDPAMLQSRNRPQNAHVLMESRFFIVLERCGIAVEDTRSSNDLRKQGGLVIPDGYARVGNMGLFLECDTGTDDLGALRTKAERYFKDRAYFEQLYSIESFRVLFVTKLLRRVQHIAEKLSGIGSGWQWLVIAEESIDPYTPASIREPIFLCVKDMA
jgi:hypothetical protein